MRLQQWEILGVPSKSRPATTLPLLPLLLLMLDGESVFCLRRGRPSPNVCVPLSVVVVLRSALTSSFSVVPFRSVLIRSVPPFFIPITEGTNAGRVVPQQLLRMGLLPRRELPRLRPPSIGRYVVIITDNVVLNNTGASDAPPLSLCCRRLLANQPFPPLCFCRSLSPTNKPRHKPKPHQNPTYSNPNPENKNKKQKQKQNTNTINTTQIYPGGLISVYYATQTGTSESFAQQLQREGRDHGFFVHVVDMEETTLDGLAHGTPFGEDNSSCGGNGGEGAGGGGPACAARAIILASTYGEGEPTDNATAMVDACKEAVEAGETPFSGAALEYAVFGLGNREYDLFNAMGKFFDESLEALGATRVFELGLGDDNEDLEADFEAWRGKMWATLKERYLRDVDLLLPKQGAATMMSAAGEGLPECEYKIVYHDPKDGIKPVQRGEVPLDKVHGSSRHHFTAIDCPVSVRRELRTPLDGGSTVHVEIGVSHDPTLRNYQTADNLGVLPLNQAGIVESVARALGYDLDAVFSLEPSDGDSGTSEWHGDPFPMPLTVRDCLTRYLDLTSAPRRSDLKLLSMYAKDPLDRRALQRLSSKEGKQEYKERITESYVGIVDVFRLCPSLDIPLEHLISVCRLMLPRFYTIASCPKVFPDSIHLTVAVTREARPDGTVFEGVCSTHLSQVKVVPPTTIAATPFTAANSVRVFVRPSSFRLPKDVSKPIIMIGPGTGIAPMRALLQERRHQRETAAAGGGGGGIGPFGANILYFGCKGSDRDYLYQDELERYRDGGVLTELHLAFSRQFSSKVYVQHLLRREAAATWRLLDESGAHVYVCGGVRMGHDVTLCLKEIICTEGHRSMDQAAAYLTKMSSQGRFVQELWS